MSIVIADEDDCSTPTNSIISVHVASSNLVKNDSTGEVVVGIVGGGVGQGPLYWLTLARRTASLI